MSSLPDVPLSVLDLSPVSEGNTVGETLRNTLDLARAAERLGYHRYWLAEHHNMPGIASSATTSGAWFGSITPPAPTRIFDVAAATCPITTAVAALAIPGMLWCSASQ